MIAIDWDIHAVVVVDFEYLQNFSKI